MAVQASNLGMFFTMPIYIAKKGLRRPFRVNSCSMLQSVGNDLHRSSTIIFAKKMFGTDFIVMMGVRGPTGEAIASYILVILPVFTFHDPWLQILPRGDS